MPDDAPPGGLSALADQAELARLRRENDRLDRLNRQLSASATVQGLRAGAQGAAAHGLRQTITLMQSSSVWRATWPLRLAIDLARGAPPGASADALRVRKAMTALRRGDLSGFAAQFGRAAAGLKASRKRPAAQAPAPLAAAANGTVSRPPAEIIAPCVLIVAELTLPQCAKYRVWQKQEMVQRLGVACRVVDWRDAAQCLSAASLATQAILYRVPGYPVVLHLIERLHRLGVPVAWEVDDLIFDTALFLQNRNLETLDPELRHGILSGVTLYRDAMLACGTGIASTPRLAEAMRSAGLPSVSVLENALDAETLNVAAGLRASRATELAMPRDTVLITYGSGTKTHDADFGEVAPALEQLLRKRPSVRLRIVGELNLPPAFSMFGERVQHLPRTPYAHYLRLLADSDISVAPLEATPFNDAKSNIKFLEAAILGVPSVCSPRAHFTAVMRDGQNGLLADGYEAWFASLDALVADAALRARLGQSALQTALARYDPACIARDQVAPLLQRVPDRQRQTGLRVLFANIYYAPRSYGGATLVVEEMARRLHARGDTEVHVATGLPHDAPDRALTRSDQDGITVWAIPVAAGDAVAEFDDPAAGDLFGQLLDAVRPDVVHLHALQWLSASLAAACSERNIPYLITLHDAWWICARQFMVMPDGHYCFQRRIDLHVCQNCNPDARHLWQRSALLHAALDGAALLLSPSEAHRQLYLANDVKPDRIVVAPNGVRLPSAPAPRQPGPVLRFAYVGGAVEIKGFSIVKRAFKALQRGDWELVLVDNTLNLGFSSVEAAEWQVQGRLTIVPAYTQDGIDTFFAGVDVLLFPSQWQESFGLTVREALARNVWVIATAGGGPGEAITDGVNGTLIPLDGRHDGLQHAVEALLNAPGRLARFTNPKAGEVMGYAAQAEALHATLVQVAADGASR